MATAGTQQVNAEALEALRPRIRGQIVTETDDGYTEASSVWNGMIERRPALVVRCTGNADVIAAVAFARENGLPLSVRGGGHNVAGTALCNGGVVVDLSAMRSVRVDLERKSARVAGGAQLGDVDHETQRFGLAVPAGVFSRTGIAGLTLHGGMGFLTRRLGLTCDNLVGADVVTADGDLLQVDEERHPDLLWALRGGGGNFGVVTSFDFRLHEVGPEVWMLIVMYPAETATEGLRAFHDFMADAPEELMALAIYWSAPHEEPIPPEWQGKPIFVAAGCWSGPIEEAEEVVRPMRELGEPVADLSGPLPYVVAQTLFDPEFPDGQRHYWKSIFVRDLEAIGPVMERAAAERPSPLTSIDVWGLGGALRREPAGGSAFARRDEPYLIGIEANWEDPADDEANLAWARGLYGELEQHSSAGAYLNFPGFGEEGERLLRASFGESYDRLRELKAKYDPENLFRSNLNIPAG